MKTKAELLPECSVATTVQLIGNKWKLLILRNLLTRPWRFNELQKNLEGISQKVLTDSLRSMEADGIITRTVYAEVPPRVEYALSESSKFSLFCATIRSNSAFISSSETEILSPRILSYLSTMSESY